MGLQVPRGENYRFKASVRLPNFPIHANIPAVAIMNGPFGDFVRCEPDDSVNFACTQSHIAGFVIANGLTDIDDPNSVLHMRCDPPFQKKDGYISI
jgi:hypothetical protein